jgi:hypothetical protein
VRDELDTRVVISLVKAEPFGGPPSESRMLLSQSGRRINSLIFWPCPQAESSILSDVLRFDTHYEITFTARLIKSYSDVNKRGKANFNRIFDKLVEGAAVSGDEALANAAVKEVPIRFVKSH